MLYYITTTLLLRNHTKIKQASKMNFEEINKDCEASIAKALQEAEKELKEHGLFNFNLPSTAPPPPPPTQQLLVTLDSNFLRDVPPKCIKHNPSLLKLKYPMLKDLKIVLTKLQTPH